MPSPDPLDVILKGSKHVAFSTWWPAEKRVEISEEFCEKFGVEPSELLRNAHQRLLPLVFADDLRVAQAQILAEFAAGATEFQVEARLRDIHGGWRSIYTFGRVIERDMMNFPSRIICHHVDVTDTKNYLRYKSLINNAPMGVFTVLADAPDTVIYMNDHLAKVLEAFNADKEPDRHAYRNRPVTSFMDSPGISRVRMLAAKWPKGDWERTEELATKLLTKHGTEVETQITMSRDEWEGKDAWLFYVIDVTDIHRREYELKKKNEELDAFAYTISHDLRAPIITIRNFLGYLEPDVREHPKKQFRDDFQRVSKAAAKLDILLQGVLELSRVGRNESNPVQLSLKQEVEQIKQSLAAEIEASGVRVEVEKQLPTITANRIRITQIFQNLLQNAIRYRDPKQSSPYVRVGVIVENGEQIFFVRDNGVGIDAISREKIFELFTRLKKIGEGAGIGLSIVKKIVEMYGGRIWVVSNEIDGDGAEFRFTLPKTSPRS